MGLYVLNLIKKYFYFYTWLFNAACFRTRLVMLCYYFLVKIYFNFEILNLKD